MVVSARSPAGDQARLDNNLAHRIRAEQGGDLKSAPQPPRPGSRQQKHPITNGPVLSFVRFHTVKHGYWQLQGQLSAHTS